MQQKFGLYKIRQKALIICVVASTAAPRTTPKPTFVDSSGTEFLLVFPWNNAPIGSKQDIYLDLINLDEFSSAHVNITYYTLNENNTSEKNEDYLDVPPTNASTVSFRRPHPLN